MRSDSASHRLKNLAHKSSMSPTSFKNHRHLVRTKYMAAVMKRTVHAADMIVMGMHGTGRKAVARADHALSLLV